MSDDNIIEFRGSEDGERRLRRKYAMVGYLGGKCFHCGKAIESVDAVEFDHKVHVGNRDDNSDRWGGSVGQWQIFTDRWFDWADKVNLICSRRCHLDKHHPKKQLSLDLEVQARLDEYAKKNGMK